MRTDDAVAYFSPFEMAGLRCLRAVKRLLAVQTVFGLHLHAIKIGLKDRFNLHRAGIFPVRRGCAQAQVIAALSTGGLLASLLAPVAQAQTAAECISPQGQQLMNVCAYKEYEDVDAALNAAWKPAKSFADAIGQGDALLSAQRAWLAYRDAACEVHASPYEGGSIQPYIRATCLSELTVQRTKMLLEFNAY